MEAWEKQKEGEAAVAAALVAARLDVESQPHDSNGAYFEYTSAEAIIRHGRQVLAKHGLALIVQSVTVLEEKWADVTVPLVFEYHLIHTSGARMIIERHFAAVIRKGFPFDKAWCAADTSLLAYTYRDLLGIDRPGAVADDIQGRQEDQPETQVRKPISEQQPPTQAPRSNPSTSRPAMADTLPEAWVQRIRELCDAGQISKDELVAHLVADAIKSGVQEKAAELAFPDNVALWPISSTKAIRAFVEGVAS